MILPVFCPAPCCAVISGSIFYIVFFNVTIILQLFAIIKAYTVFTLLVIKENANEKNTFNLSYIVLPAVNGMSQQRS